MYDIKCFAAYWLSLYLRFIYFCLWADKTRNSLISGTSCFLSCPRSSVGLCPEKPLAKALGGEFHPYTIYAVHLGVTEGCPTCLRGGYVTTVDSCYSAKDWTQSSMLLLSLTACLAGNCWKPELQHLRSCQLVRTATRGNAFSFRWLVRASPSHSPVFYLFCICCYIYYAHCEKHVSSWDQLLCTVKKQNW